MIFAALIQPTMDGGWDGLNTINYIVKFFRDSAGAGWQNLMPHAIELVTVLAIIDIAVNWSLYKGDLRLTEIISKIIKYGVIFFMIFNLANINGYMINSFKQAGLIAAGVSDTNSAKVVSEGPAGVLRMGFQAIGVIVDDNGNVSVPSKDDISKLKAEKKPVPVLAHLANLDFYELPSILMDFIAIALILFSFFMMTVELAISIVEFNIFAAIMVILLPFGAIKYTSFLLQRSISAVFQFGIKLMLIYFMLALVMNTVLSKSGALNTESFGSMLVTCMIYLTLGYLTTKIPSLISGMLSGQPSMSGNGVANSMASAPAAAARGAASAAGGTAAVLAASRVTSRYGPDGKAHGVAVGASLKALGGNLAGMALARNPVGKAVLRGADKGNEAMRAGNAIKNGNWKRMTDEQMNLDYKNANDKGQRLNSAAQQQQTAYDNAKVTNTTKLGADINRSLNNLNRPSSPNPKNTPYNPKK